MMSSGKLCFRKPNKTLGLTNFFSAKTAPNSKRVRCAVYKRLRENGASWAKQLNDSTSGSFGEGGGGGGEEKNSFCLLNDCWWLLYCTSLHLMGNKKIIIIKKKKTSYMLRKVNKNHRFLRVCSFKFRQILLVFGLKLFRTAWYASLYH